MSLVENLYKNIQQGRTGLNQGISTGIPKLDDLTYGVQRKWLTVIAGDSGSGKSVLSLYTYVYSPFKQYMLNKETDVHFLLFSFEMSAEVLLAKLLSLYIYDTFHEIVSYDEILSLTGKCSDYHFELINQSREWLQEFESKCEIIDKPVTAKGLYAVCKEWSQKFGTYKDSGTIGEYTKTEYIPHNPKQYLIVVVDHIKLLSVSSGHTAKQEIDEACDYLIHFRNKCNFTEVIIQQLNRNFKSMDRRNSANNLLGLEDLSDSGGPAQAAETVIGIYHPFREKLPRCEGYDIRQLKDRFRLIQILKHRFGQADRSMGCNFFGEISLWKELPLPQDINDYEQYIKLT